MVKDCPERASYMQERELLRAAKAVCPNCDQEGHQLRMCPEPRKNRSKGNRGRGYDQDQIDKCDDPGDSETGHSGHKWGGDNSHRHYGRPERSENDNRGCYNCFNTGHIARDCPEPRTERRRSDAMVNTRAVDESEHDIYVRTRILSIGTNRFVHKSLLVE